MHVGKSPEVGCPLLHERDMMLVQENLENLENPFALRCIY